MIDFEYDEAKSLTNRQKHGINFIKAQDLWQDANRIEIPAQTEDEPRFLIIGNIDNKYWSTVITY
jgi:uncharacterized DUF497 family protein